MKTKGKTYKCNHCKTEEFIPEGEFGLKTEQITAIYCPICQSKKKSHRYKMYEVKKQ